MFSGRVNIEEASWGVQLLLQEGTRQIKGRCKRIPKDKNVAGTIYSFSIVKNVHALFKGQIDG